MMLWSKQPKFHLYINMRFSFLKLCMLFAVAACTRKQPSLNKFSDEVLVRIADYQDKRLSDSLFQYLGSNNALLRKEAVLAFASIQDTTAIEEISVLLNDVDASVRQAAALALGQTGAKNAATKLLLALPNESDSLVYGEIIEALGKTISKEQLPQLWQQDLKMSSRFGWCLYRLGLRGIADSTAVYRATTLLNQDLNFELRLGAAHFFARGPATILPAHNQLIQSCVQDPAAEVRMACASALRKLKTAEAEKTLQHVLREDADYRVRVNAVRALSTYPNSFNLIYEGLNDANLAVQIATSEVISAASKKEHFLILVQAAKRATNWRVQANLYDAALGVSNSKGLVEEIIRVYQQAENAYVKAGLLQALGQAPLAYSFIQQELLTSTIPVIRSTSAAALVSINRHSDFNTELKNTFKDIYKQAIKTNDPAVIGTIASALGDSVLAYKQSYSDITFLYEAKKALSLPRDNEALQPLEATIAYFEGRSKIEPVKNEFNNPIDWSLVKSIPHDQQVKITTDKGDIILQLLVNESPGSVANFVHLIQLNYFNQKNFHRVVPNFVIQGGCNRGDGWGSEDYSIRSEFSLRKYQEGSVGMASAGKDTEGTQWFITHSPTPHLDGRYTIFANVVSGMETVHQIEVGDVIHQVILIESN
jgi:cyclophilin family peptidyl-prolyl cis-trans isomerase/HEAT repeat protein